MRKYSNTETEHVQLHSDERFKLDEFEHNMELEGECKIKEISYLKFNLVKAVVLTFLLSITFIGLVLLLWYKSLRAKVFYSPSNDAECTHLYILAQEKRIEDIEEV